MKSLHLIAVIALSVTVSANAYDSKFAGQPKYDGSCENDSSMLDNHFTYWNSGNHGSDAMDCKYAVDQLIIHQEMEYYISRPKRCQNKGMTYVPTTGTNYTGMMYEINSDDELKKKLISAASNLRGVSCSPTDEQRKELQRQSKRG